MVAEERLEAGRSRDVCDGRADTEAGRRGGLRDPGTPGDQTRSASGTDVRALRLLGCFPEPLCQIHLVLAHPTVYEPKYLRQFDITLC